MRSRGNKTSHPAQFKDSAGEDSGWLLATDPHDPTRRACLSLMIRWGSGSKPPRNEPLIYRRAASRGTVSKTIGVQISVDPSRCPPAAKAF
ncbi:hypothetical protein T02_6755 [Trichinella nativa]|uniref:Uncharacterized protein n=1 Tax=Trichinella nativa TaxID=6335 RepID=A0A0V1L5W0_9BILA|nr:hypothetical protein T02_6755 [Trichinella nativa]